MMEQYTNQGKKNAEAQLRRCHNLDYRTQEQFSDTERRQIARMNLQNRAQEQVTDTERRQIARTNPHNRAQEHIANTERRQIARTESDNRAKEQVTNMERRQIARTNPVNRAQEQVVNTEWRQIARSNLTYKMATKFDVSSGTHTYTSDVTDKTMMSNLFVQCQCRCPRGAMYVYMLFHVLLVTEVL
jgi:hypothetical protein